MEDKVESMLKEVEEKLRETLLEAFNGEKNTPEKANLIKQNVMKQLNDLISEGYLPALDVSKGVKVVYRKNDPTVLYVNFSDEIWKALVNKGVVL